MTTPLKAYVYEGSKIPMAVDEGAWTNNDQAKEGGAFASPISDGDFVKLVTGRSMTVIAASGASDMPVGFVLGSAMGTNARYGRQATVQLFGEFMREVGLDITSAAVAPGDRLLYLGPNLFIKDLTPYGSVTIGTTSITLSGASQLFTLSHTSPTLSVTQSNRLFTLSEAAEIFTLSEAAQPFTLSGEAQEITVSGGQHIFTVSGDAEVITISGGTQSFTVSEGNHIFTVSGAAQTVSFTGAISLSEAPSSVIAFDVVALLAITASGAVCKALFGAY